MPRSSEDRQHALDVMEWAHDSAAAVEAAPEEVRRYRAFCERVFVGEAHWRVAFDLALEIWAKGYTLHLKKQAAF